MEKGWNTYEENLFSTQVSKYQEAKRYEVNLQANR